MVIKNSECINADYVWNERKMWQIEESFILKQKLQSENFLSFKLKCSLILNITYEDIFKQIYWESDFEKLWIEHGIKYFVNCDEYWNYVTNYLELELDKNEFYKIYKNWKQENFIKDDNCEY